MFFTPTVAPLVLDTLMDHMVLSLGDQMGVMCCRWGSKAEETPRASSAIDRSPVSPVLADWLTVLSDSSQNTAHTQAETQVFWAPLGPPGPAQQP